jgi:hypothetical protein
MKAVQQSISRRSANEINNRSVMPGLVPGIHVFFHDATKTWMAGTSPAMTA